ncbi:MAG: hypothetical protein KF761_10175 [Salinibacterium sp.]|nr:hypothetical protein [Salinibacterium sp.]
MPHSSHPQIIGGYRLLRVIGAGSRAEVFIAHPVVDLPHAVPVVMKIYGPAVTDESVYLEVESLSRAAGEHVVRVIDVASTLEGAPVLILSRHAASSLARVLVDRATLEAGEAITILAPIASALARLHSAGVAHGSLGPGSVLFDAAGAPTLACFGRASIFTPHLPVARIETEPAVLADVVAFGVLAATVLDRANATELAQSARTEAAPGAWLVEFAERLFELAQPLPVDLRPRQLDGAVLPSRVIETSRAITENVADIAPQTPTWRERVVNALRRVRRPVWITAGASLAALLLAVVALPRAEPEAAQPVHAATPESVSVREGPVDGDDPIAAARVLLETRERCIRDLDELCFGDVDQRNSAALDEDRALVRSIVDGGAATLPSLQDLELVQRLGDSALISLGADSEPASVLLVKGEAGWRIRDYLEE